MLSNKLETIGINNPNPIISNKDAKIEDKIRIEKNIFFLNPKSPTKLIICFYHLYLNLKINILLIQNS